MTDRARRTRGAILLTGVLGLAGCATSQRHVPSIPSRTVHGQVLTSTSAPEAAIEVLPPFEYVGNNRFILRGHTDVEQHFFIVGGAGGQVERMYWLQFEAKLPDAEGSYEYEPDESVQIGPLSFVAHVRHYDAEPETDSDRGAAYRFLSGLGYEVPTPALRARFVHVPDADRRRELMIVYLERVESTRAITAEEKQAVLSRARSGLSIRSRR